LVLPQGARRENILQGSLTDEQRGGGAKDRQRTSSLFLRWVLGRLFKLRFSSLGRRTLLPIIAIIGDADFIPRMW
jgi:hypothetical protein